jgi:hypothetical protein
MKNTIGTLPKCPPLKKTWKETKSIPFAHNYMTFLALNNQSPKLKVAG